MPKYKPGDKRIKEDWVKKRVKEILKPYRGIMVDMPASNMYGASGRHDFIICQQGLFWTIETKAGKNKPTANQVRYAEEVRRAGGMSVLINEFNLDVVGEVAMYVDTFSALPKHLSTNFTQYL